MGALRGPQPVGVGSAGHCRNVPGGDSGPVSTVCAPSPSWVTYIDTIPWFCTAVTCAAMVDNLLVSRDDNHITATYSGFLAPVGAQIDLLTNGRL